MNASTQREEELFDAALSLPAAERRAFLDRMLGAAEDACLRGRLDELLRAHDQAEDLEKPLPAVQTNAEAARATAAMSDRLVGTRIGRFKLLEPLGEGGCGVVYLAEQEEPIRRRVALKIIKAGMDTNAVIARFEAERQALALMDHPNIARVLDGGATETGRPYFVMELVQGVPITHYCDEGKLSPRERLKLFVQVCDAVQHAHQKGIIHRDLKPSNILVATNDGVAVPKVIDFGIAKALGDLRLTDKTLLTRFNDFVGTPVYMSPEQAVMTALDVDTRSDVYSLGVLLYELLTAQLPFDRATLECAGIDEMRRVLREVDPPQPSVRVNALTVEERTAVAQRRSIEPTRLPFLLRTDLDWIVLRCLEKDRARRYETVNGLAKDIQRHLDEEPVLARPPNAGYRLRKFMRRHRIAAVSGAAVFLALALGFSISTWQAIRAVRAEHEQRRLREQALREQELANAARGHAEGLLSFLLDDFYNELQPIGRVEMVHSFAHRLIAYYDSLPADLRNEDTDRNRAFAKLREGGALLRGAHFAEGAAALQEGQEFFEKRYAANENDEGAALDLATALVWQFSFGHANTQIPWKKILEQFRRAADLARPHATRPNATARARRLYAEALSHIGYRVRSGEEGIRYSAEARTILRALGATDLSDPTLTYRYCLAGDGQANACLLRGKLDEAEQINNECGELADRLLAKRPSDLGAMSARSVVIGTKSSIAERRFHLARAVELAEEAVRASEEMVKFDQEGIATRVVLWRNRLRLSDLYWKLGRGQDSLKISYEVLGQLDAFPLERDWTLPERSYFQWQDNLYRECERGDRAAAQRCVVGFTRQAEKLRQLGGSYLIEYVNTSKRFVDYSSPQDLTWAFADAREDLKRLEAMPRTQEHYGYWHVLHNRALLNASVAGGRAGRDAEVETLVRAEMPTLPTIDFNLGDQLEPRLWLALALARQNKAAECSEELQRLLAFYRHAWDQGGRSIHTLRGLGFALYVQAINERDDVDGRTRRRAALDEAAQVLDALTTEAKQLYSWREVIGWVATERARQW